MGLTSGARRLPLLLAAATLWCGPATASAQASVRSAEVAVDLTAGDGSAFVRAEYRLGPAAPATVEVELLAPEGVTAGDVRATGAERVALWPASGTRRSAAVAIDSAEGEATLTLEYRIDGAVSWSGVSVHARVPVISVSLPPDERGDVFRASVRVPDEWAVSEGFPTGLRPAGGGAYAVSLPVVPSVISLRARTDGAWRPGFTLLLELVTAAVLAAFGIVGWRRLAARRP